MQLSTAADLTRANTLALPCQAEVLIKAYTADDLVEARLLAHHQQLPIVVLGAGSNVVLPQQLHSVVLQWCDQQRELLPPGPDCYRVRLGGGGNWHDSVTWLMQQGLHGLENLALIPGTVGAAPVQNIGAYGVELSRFVELVEVFDLAQGVFTELSAQQCGFSYRHSVFKEYPPGRFVITAVQLCLPRQHKVIANYPALASELQAQGISQPSPQQIYAAVVAVRQQRLPDPGQLPNVGSFFKNPVVTAVQAEQLARQHPGVVAYPQADGSVKLAAGWLLQQAGWRGRSQGPVATHAEQALVIVNHGGATAGDVIALAQTLAGAVQHQFAVTLELEPSYFTSHGQLARLP